MRSRSSTIFTTTLQRRTDQGRRRTTTTAQARRRTTSPTTKARAGLVGASGNSARVNIGRSQLLRVRTPTQSALTKFVSTSRRMSQSVCVIPRRRSFRVFQGRAGHPRPPHRRALHQALRHLRHAHRSTNGGGWPLSLPRRPSRPLMSKIRLARRLPPRRLRTRRRPPTQMLLVSKQPLRMPTWTRFATPRKPKPQYASAANDPSCCFDGVCTTRVCRAQRVPRPPPQGSSGGASCRASARASRSASPQSKRRSSARSSTRSSVRSRRTHLLTPEEPRCDASPFSV
jgi:hypothetical protein